MAGEELISVNEAKAVVARAGYKSGYRTLLMVTVGLIFVICAVLLVMLLSAFRGAETGLSGLLPFKKQENQILQLEP